MLKVAEVMTRDVGTCRPEASLADAARIMWNRDCGVVPVTDAGGRLSGVLTDRDACMAALTRGKALSDIDVASVMKTSPATCREDDDLAKAAETMGREQVRRLPVVDAVKRVVGVVSINDLAVHALETQHGSALTAVATTLGRICRHRSVPVP